MEKGALIGQGRTADVYAWGSDRILKLYREGFPAVPVQHEFKLTRAAQEAGVPVPAVENLIEIDGRYGIIFERLDGSSLLKSLSSQPWNLIATARKLAELHTRVHDCILPPNTFPPFRAQIERAILGVKDLPESSKGVALSRLANLPDGQSLCHGDFHPDNVLITSRGPVIIDWMTASRGDPLTDVCRTSMIFDTTILPPGMPVPIRLLFGVLRLVIRQTYVSRYLQLRPSPRRDVHRWLLPLLTARLREVDGYPQEKERILARIQSLL